MRNLIKICIWEAEKETIFQTTDQYLTNAREHSSVPIEFDDASEINMNGSLIRSLRVHAIYDGGETLDCWLDFIDGELRWLGNSDW